MRPVEMTVSVNMYIIIFHNQASKLLHLHLYSKYI